MTYVWLKEEVETDDCGAVRLGQVVQMTPENGALEEETLTPHRLSNGMRYVTQLDVARALRRHSPQLQAQLLGSKRCWISVKASEAPKGRMHAVLTVLTAIVMFAASFFTIMNFHADVGMTDVHENLLTIFAGGRGNAALWIGIPYSIGVVLGSLLFVLPRGKKRRLPDPMEVQNAIYENEVKQYMRSGAEEQT